MIIIESHISQSPNDKQEITPTLSSLASLPEELGKVETILADAGYYSDDNVSACEKAEIEPFIPPGRENIISLLLSDLPSLDHCRQMQTQSAK